MGPRPSEPEATFFECWVCGKPALYVIELSGEDEERTEAAACADHARGHAHRGLLTPLEENAGSP